MIAIAIVGLDTHTHTHTVVIRQPRVEHSRMGPHDDLVVRISAVTV